MKAQTFNELTHQIISEREGDLITRAGKGVEKVATKETLSFLRVHIPQSSSFQSQLS